jgi:hypothetical protein
MKKFILRQLLMYLWQNLNEADAEDALIAFNRMLSIRSML